MLKVHPYQFVFSQVGERLPQVTVCISLYSYQDYIVKTLESVRKQTQLNLDLIVVEDRGTDNSLAIAKNWMQRYAQRFNSIHLVQHEQNQGLSAARNTAIGISQNA